MKKLYLLTILALSSVIFIACQQKTEQVTSTNAEQTSSSEKNTKIDYALYDGVIDNYAKVLKKENINGLDINSLSNQATMSSGFYMGIEYSQYDFDKNGTDDLLVALVSKEGVRSLLDVRTIVEGKMVRLTNHANQLDMIGERMFLMLLEDGTFLYKGSSSVFNQTYIHYRLNSTKTDLEKIVEGKTEAELGKLASLLNLSKLEWKSVTTKRSDNIDTSQASDMNIAEIQKGNYSSIAGTWTNGMGMTLTFNNDGLVSDTSIISMDYASTIDGFLKASIKGKSNDGGMAIAFLPAGVSLTESVTHSQNSGFSDSSDVSKDRIWAGQQVLSDKRVFYYKVK